MTGPAGYHTPLPAVNVAWMDNARCKGSDPSIWFPTHGDYRTVAAAKAFCATCPVRSDCLDYAVIAGEKFGIWGGAGERERRRRRGQLLAIPTGPCPVCGATFTRRDRHHIYCTPACQKRAENERRRNARRHPIPDMHKGTP